MAERASSSAKKTGKANRNAGSKVTRGDSVVCEVCGLSVVVEEVGDVAVSEETTLFCCGKPMKAHRSPRKARAAKTTKATETLSGWPMSQAAGSSGPVADPSEDVNQQ